MFSLQTIFGSGKQFYTLLEEAADAAYDAAKALHVMMKASDRQPALDAFKLARLRERAASDKIGQALVDSFMTPIEREDIEALGSALYKIPKQIEKFADRYSLATRHLEHIDFAPRAAMLADYVTMPGNSGYHLYPPEWVRDKVLKAVQNGWSVCAHSTGDRDTAMLLDAYEEALAWYKAETGLDNRTLRLRLEHTMFVNPELIDRIEKAQIIVNVRPCGRLSPGDAPGGPHQKQLGEERWRHSRPIRPFVERGMRVNFGCDYPAPCGFLDPAASIFSATGGIGEPKL